MNKIKNKNNGITLIALIITIIVMLILVSVTITMAVNGGLFDYAGKAVSETQNAINVEQQLADGKIKVGGVWYNSIDEYLVGGVTASTMQSNLTTYLGQTITYGVEYKDVSTYGNGEWEIFYSDGEHIYIITRGHLAEVGLTITGYNGSSDFTAESLSTKYPAVAAGLLNKIYNPTSVGSELKYTSTSSSMKATQYLLDSTVWASYANNEYAEWAIGAPTYELFVKSFNAYYPDLAVTVVEIGSQGYVSGLSSAGSVPPGSYLNHSSGAYWWIASPHNYRGGHMFAMVESRGEFTKP